MHAPAGGAILLLNASANVLPGPGTRIAGLPEEAEPEPDFPDCPDCPHVGIVNFDLIASSLVSSIMFRLCNVSNVSLHCLIMSLFNAILLERSSGLSIHSSELVACASRSGD